MNFSNDTNICPGPDRWSVAEPFFGMFPIFAWRLLTAQLHFFQMGPAENPIGDLSWDENAAFLLVSKLPTISWAQTAGLSRTKTGRLVTSDRGCILIPRTLLQLMTPCMEFFQEKKNRPCHFLLFQRQNPAWERLRQEEGDSCSDD